MLSADESSSEPQVHSRSQVSASTAIWTRSDAASVANFDNIFLLARHRLLRRLGRADEATMTAVCAAASLTIGCR